MLGYQGFFIFFGKSARDYMLANEQGVRFSMMK